MKQIIYRYGYLFLVLMVMGLSFSSCKVGKSYVRPELNLLDSLASKQDSTSVADLHWWEVYTDPLLVSLIEQALEYNKDVLIAAARIKEMAAKNRISTANMLPQLNGQVSASNKTENDRGEGTSHSDTYSGKLLLSWEIDLWGNLRWGKQASVAEYLKTIEAQRALQMTIISEVAQAYYELVALDNELIILNQTLEDRKASVRLARIRFEGGMTSEIPYQQAQVEMARTATLIPEQDRKIAIKENTIAMLVGSYPKVINRSSSLEDLFKMKELPYGLPSSLLERRPDVRASEQQLRAAHARVGVAFTDMFPRISLTGKLGYESSEFSSFLKSPYSLIEGALLTPIFNMGKNRAAWKAQKAVYEQELYSYERTVLNAFKESKDAIVNYNQQREVHNLKSHLEKASKKYSDLAHLQYLNGVISYIDVLDAQRMYFDAQVGLNNAVRDELLAMIQLYKVLGGGW